MSLATYPAVGLIVLWRAEGVRHFVVLVVLVDQVLQDSTALEDFTTIIVVSFRKSTSHRDAKNSTSCGNATYRGSACR